MSDKEMFEENKNAINSEIENNNNPTGTAPESPPRGYEDTNSQAHSQNVVRDVRELLGQDVVLLPVVAGEKRPVVAGWQNGTIEWMSDPKYLESFEGKNIGVLVGSASGGLCAIDIDDDDEVEPFLALNPTLRNTLRTKGERGAQIWVRIVGGFEKLTKLEDINGEAWGEWRADGGQSVVHGRHPSGRDYQILQKAPPISVDFSEIKWPDYLVLPWVKTPYDRLVEEEGEPFFVGDRGSVVINQLFFVRKYILEHHVLYDSSLGDFFLYESKTGLWLRQTVESLKRQFLADLTAAARKTGLKQVFLKRSDALVAGLVALLKAQVEEHEAFADRPEAIHVANGMICFEGDEVVLKSFHPDFRSRNACPFEFDPTAECPRFLNELLGVALDAEDIGLLQRWSGAVLMGRNRAQRLLLLLGMPNGGKSTVINILEQTIGLKNVAQIRTEHLANQFEMYSFVGKTLLTGKDVAANFLSQKGAYVIKALVGYDLIDAEKKGFNQRVQIRGDFNIGITCNTDLNIKLEGDVGAWRRRLLVLKYERPAPSKRIADFAEQLLREEGPGILRWMVQGAIALTDEINETGNYHLTLKQQRRVDKLLDQSDSVRRFVSEHLKVSPASDSTMKEIQSAYYDFCEGRGWHPVPPDQMRAQLPQAILEFHRTTARNDIPREGKDQRGYKNLMILEVNHVR